MQAKPSLEDTLSLMRDLRARCEWDAAQTHDSLRPYLIEEAYEVDDAIRAGDDSKLREELVICCFKFSSIRSSPKSAVRSQCTTLLKPSSRK